MYLQVFLCYFVPFDILKNVSYICKYVSLKKQDVSKMNIKRTVSTFIQKQYTDSGEYSIRISVRWKKERTDKNEFVAFNVGHAILPKNWNSNTARVKKNCINS